MLTITVSTTITRCSAKARGTGIRHGTFVGEPKLEPLYPNSNKVDKLHNYRITISPPTNFLIKHPNIIQHDSYQFPPPARQHAQADVQGSARPRGEGKPAAGAADQHQAEARLHGRGIVPGGSGRPA